MLEQKDRMQILKQTTKRYLIEYLNASDHWVRIPSVEYQSFTEEEENNRVSEIP